jgi:uncharacterized protein (TIGR03083 family)
MKIAEHIQVLDHDGRLLAEAAERAGLDAEVPTCPGWQVRDLLGHIGGVHRWAASHVAEGRVKPHSEAAQEAFFGTVEDAGLVSWFREGHRALVDTLAGADESVACWTFLPAPSPLAFWSRRQAHETAIHLADAEAATGSLPRWDPAFAADGIDELFNGFFSRPGGRLRADPPRSMAVAATDIGAGWTVHIEPDGRRVFNAVDPAEMTLSGPARELYLLLWNRGGVERVEVSGDPEVLRLWQSLARVRWS